MPNSATEIKCRNKFSHLKDISLSEVGSLEVVSEGYMRKNPRKRTFLFETKIRFVKNGSHFIPKYLLSDFYAKMFM